MSSSFFQITKSTLADIPQIHIREQQYMEQKIPVIILQHGLFGTKERNILMGLELAKEGFFVILPEASMHGERYSESLIQLLREHPINSIMNVLLETKDDIIRLLDELKDLIDIQISKVGITGVSMGGLLTYMVGMADPRIQAMAPIIGSSRYLDIFRYSSINRELGIPESVIQTITIPTSIHEALESLDPVYHPEKLLLRPLLHQFGEQDTIIPVNLCLQTADAIQEAYRDAPERFQSIGHPNVGHELTPNMVKRTVEFFKKIFY